MQGNSCALAVKSGFFKQSDGKTYVKDDLGEWHFVPTDTLMSLQSKWEALDPEDIPKLIVESPEIFRDSDDDLYLVVLAEKFMKGML